MPSPLLPPGRTGTGERPRSAPRLAMGAVTLVALAAAAWAAVIALTAAEPFSCALTSEDVAANHCNQVVVRFGELSPVAVLPLLLPPAFGVALGWWGVLRVSSGRRPPVGGTVAGDLQAATDGSGGVRGAYGAWVWVAAGAVPVLGGLVGCALRWVSLTGAAPPR
ncbi:hypothetical protein [Nocardiopsis sp. CC223A]|uniref:hypothetical protein n=1 Tax=Nocardiopsis sp. CC223A TaxID=3044051 RepID=UPI00278BCA9E|nr:hypothetical protein [Nocardiopsis sp. CC223A]